MGGKTQIDFEYAKMAATSEIDKINNFISLMSAKFPDCGFHRFQQQFQVLKYNVRRSSVPSLSIQQFEQLERFSRHLTTNQCFIKGYFINSRVSSKLHQFWNLYKAIAGPTGKADQSVLWEVNEKVPSERDAINLTKSIQKAHEVKKITEHIVGAILERPRGILSITSILLVLIIRVEAHEHEIKNIMSKAKKSVSLNYDIEEMCSVDTKVQKGKGFRSDVRAIRDAVSHAHFTISNNNNDYIVHFRNFEDGYNFDKKITGKEMLLFYQDYDRILIVQTMLLKTALLYQFLLDNFKK